MCREQRVSYPEEEQMLMTIEPTTLTLLLLSAEREDFRNLRTNVLASMIIIGLMFHTSIREMDACIAFI